MPSTTSPVSSSTSTPMSTRSRALSTEIVTPRTKIRQLLATVDSSDDEKGPVKPQASIKRKLVFSEDSRQTDKTVSSGADEDDDGSDMEGERATWKSKGRLAGRMMGKIAGDTEQAGLRNDKDISPGERQNQSNTANHVNKIGENKSINETVASRPNIASDNDQSTSHITAERVSDSAALSRADSASARTTPEKPGDVPSANTNDRSAMRKRIEEMIAKRKAEREQRENKVKRKRSLYKDSRGKEIDGHRQRSLSPEVDSNEDEEDINQKLTQQARPTRKASKKALEEMHRETQRISRNQQLTHQIVTRKRVTKEDLFARFAFKPQQSSENNTSKDQKDQRASSSQAEDLSTDGVAELDDTPPSTPPSTQGSSKVQPDEPNQPSLAPAQNMKRHTVDEVHTDLPITELLVSMSKFSSKGKGRAFESEAHRETPYCQTSPRKDFATKEQSLKSNSATISDDDELEIVGHQRNSKLSVFDQLSTKKSNEPKTLHMLRRLAHIESPALVSKKSDKTSMTPAQLQASLQARARRQTLAERKERIDELKAKGVVVQTEEERQKEMLEIENLLEKAREQDRALSKKERDARKNKGEESEGEADYDYSDDEEDEDWNVDDEGSALELSEDEEEVEEEDEEDENQEKQELDLGHKSGEEKDTEEGIQDTSVRDKDIVGTEAKEVGSHIANESRRSEDESFKEKDCVPAKKSLQKKRRIITDDDDEDDERTTESEQNISRNATPKALSIGLPFVPPLPIGLTQAFAGSMDSVETQLQEENTPTNQRNANISVFPNYVLPPTALQPTQDLEPSETLVQSSQGEKPNAYDQTNRPEIEEFDLPLTQLLNGNMSQPGEIPEPTPIKDINMSTLPPNDIDDVPSTVETVVAPVPESPIKKPRRLFRRRNESLRVYEDSASENDNNTPSTETGPNNKNDAFRTMRKRAERARVAAEYDKRKSEAKEMFEEQAVESEDEYAGLGGASDDESGGEGDEEVNGMIDETEVQVDERKIAAYYADKERVEDEKKIERLLKDVTNGGLRRKRAADFDLSDSDDEVEARKRRKRNEFARMKKALLQDENIGKIAENPKKLAFLQAIEDQDENKDLGLLNEQNAMVLDSQIKQPMNQQIPLNQVNNSNSRDNKVTNTDTLREARRPYYERRTKPHVTKKPASLAEIRKTLSSVIDDPSVVPNSQVCDAEDDSAFNGDTMDEQSTIQVVNRISLSRTSTCASDNSSRLAFHTTDSSASNSSRIPSLLRRATAGIEIDENIPKSARIKAVDSESVRRGGSKKSSINYQVREAERRQMLEAADRQRKAGVKTVVKNRRSVLSVINSATAFEMNN